MQKDYDFIEPYRPVKAVRYICTGSGKHKGNNIDCKEKKCGHYYLHRKKLSCDQACDYAPAGCVVCQ